MRIDADLTDTFKAKTSKKVQEELAAQAESLEKLFKKALKKDGIQIKMEKLKDFVKYVEGEIDYTFENVDLLYQAFTRRSYTHENGGENNEILEFIGDKVLDFAVVKFLIQKYETTKNRPKALLFHKIISFSV